MSFWGVVSPEARTNLVCNPSAETTGNYAPIGATVTHEYTQARWGIKSYRIVTAGTSQGLFCFMTTASNTTHYASWYAWAVTGTMRVTADSGANYNTASIIGGRTGAWVRYGATLPPAETSQSAYLGIIDTANDGTIYIDGVQCEAGTYPTTYIDGDMEGLYRWNGLRHGSSSTRDAQERSGGKETDFDTEFGITVNPTFSGVGMPPIKNNLQSMALQPGALLQSQKTLPREITLDFNINAQSGATWPTLHQKRQALINLVKPDRTRGAQPFTLIYKGADNGAGRNPLYAKFVYASGLEFGNITRGFLDRPQVRCLAVDPAWYEDNQETQTLTMQSILGATTYGAERLNGEWKALGTGPNLAVSCIKVDKARGRVWFGGYFTTASGVACNRIAYWNGSTFVAVGGATVGTTGGAVHGITLMPNGDAWVVGDFTTAGGVVARGVARWNNSSDTFTGFDLTTAAYSWKSGAVDSNGNVYLAGNFLNWNGITTNNYITKYLPDGTWSTVGSQPYTTNEYPTYPYCVAIDYNDNLIIGSTPTTSTVHGVLRKWDGANWSILGSTTGGLDTIAAVYIGKDNTIYVGGGFVGMGGVLSDNIIFYNGSLFVSMDGGLGNASSAINCIDADSKGLIYVRGSWGEAHAEENINLWNGSKFVDMDIITGEAPGIQGSSIGILNDDIFVGWASKLTAYSITGVAASIPNHSTVSVFPKLAIIGPSAAGTTAALVWLENQSTAERLYLNLNVLSGDAITIDMRSNKKTISSDWSGTVYGQPLSGSDFAAFHLLPTTNTIVLFMTGKATTTSGSAAIIQWTPAHWSIDGVA